MRKRFYLSRTSVEPRYIWENKDCLAQLALLLSLRLRSFGIIRVATYCTATIQAHTGKLHTQDHDAAHMYMIANTNRSVRELQSTHHGWIAVSCRCISASRVCSFFARVEVTGLTRLQILPGANERQPARQILPSRERRCPCTSRHSRERAIRPGAGEKLVPNTASSVAGNIE
nr:hypothetical protein CFP56_57000 [Quercus suber]